MGKLPEVLPKVIEEVGFDFDWSNRKVWALNVPITEIDISKLEWHFKIPFWNLKPDSYNLKPIDVINFPEKHKIEHNRTMKCDSSYPIDIMRNKGRLLIIDGLHRLVKAKIQGKTKVRVRNIPRSMISQITI
jgi:hypothetical protein